MNVAVTVAVLTYRRPTELARLLDSLPARLAEVEDADVHVVVVDNDPDGAGRRVVADHPVGARYVLEPSPGIAAARAAAIEQACDADLLAFIDDDEIALPGWLRELVRVWRATGAAAVAGRVQTVLPPDIDPWLRAVGYFSRPDRVTGTRVRAAATSNLLLDLHQVRESGVRFDPTLGLSGGEDTLFTYQLTDAGREIVWCHESVVDSPLSAERLDRTWALARAYGHGNTDAEIALRRADGRLDRLAVAARWTTVGLMRIGVGAARELWGRWRNDLRHESRGTRSMHRGRGILAGVRGDRFHEYHRPG
ncbi:glycosyltransferase [Tersicoccus sp. MR15.9]|uniref:glycosyltransferase family 2 protein n=1 Tax=Tersicoccus mangrovi TaxID=3121635 RepID=UPI002FE6B7CB